MNLQLLLALIGCGLCYDKKKFASTTEAQSFSTASTPNINSDVDWLEYFDVSKCELLSRCQPCSFKEL